MFRLPLGCSQACDGLSRRQFIQVGGLSAFALGLPNWLRARADLPAERRKEVNCILLWMQGGPSHIDTFDPKPDAPREVRGEFKTIPTSDPSVHLCEHLPKLAANFDKFSIVRGGDPRNGSHGMADYIMMSGQPVSASVIYPCYGSVIAQQRGYRNNMLPFVQLGGNVDRSFSGGVAGILGDQYNPFEVVGDPSQPNFRVRDISLANDEAGKRLQRRRRMLEELEKHQKAIEASDSPVVKAQGAFYEKAFGIITSPEAKRAFDVNQEPARLRDEYGRNAFGQSCLLARRLIEAGVHFVTVTEGGWDTHQNNFQTLRERRLPRLDQAYAALLKDLAERGLLANTLVIWMGDFGRTPKVNSSAGRDHWATAGVICLGGGGAPLGRVIGKTDANGERVIDCPVTPADLAASVYHLLGVPAGTIFHAPDGRPVHLITDGKVAPELIA
jgi:hypothetical protein